jgi:hypothetical protein
VLYQLSYASESSARQTTRTPPTRNAATGDAATRDPATRDRTARDGGSDRGRFRFDNRLQLHRAALGGPVGLRLGTDPRGDGGARSDVLWLAVFVLPVSISLEADGGQKGRREAEDRRTTGGFPDKDPLRGALG